MLLVMRCLQVIKKADAPRRFDFEFAQFEVGSTLGELATGLVGQGDRSLCLALMSFAEANDRDL